MTERIGTAQAADILGCSRRFVQLKAETIPSARRFAGKWTFREDALRQWVRDQERCQTICTDDQISPGASGTREDISQARKYEKAYEQAMSG